MPGVRVGRRPSSRSSRSFGRRASQASIGSMGRRGSEVLDGSGSTPVETVIDRSVPPTRSRNVSITNADTAFSQHALSINGKEMLQAHAVGDALRTMGLNPDEAEVRALIKSEDAKQTGFISRKAFLAFAEAQNSSRYTINELEEMFYAFDVNQQGWLDAKEFKTIFSGTQVKLTENEIEEMMYVADTKMDGKIRLADFISLMAPDMVLGPGRAPPERALPPPEDNSVAEYMSSLMRDAQAAKERSASMSRSRQQELLNWTDQLAQAEAELKQAKRRVATACAAGPGDEWAADGGMSPCSPLANVGMRDMCQAKLANATSNAKAKSEGFLKFEKEYLDEVGRIRGKRADPILYKDTMQDKTDQLTKIYQLRSYLECDTTLLPPGLFDVKADPGWPRLQEEQKKREALRQCYLLGLAGRDLPGKSPSHDEKQAHSLGVARKFDGKALAKADTPLTFRSAGDLHADPYAFEGLTLFQLLPCDREVERSEARACAAYSSTALGGREESSGAGKAEQLCREKGYTAHYGDTFFLEDNEQVAGAMKHDATGTRLRFVQLLSKEGAAVQDFYEAGLMGEGRPKAPVIDGHDAEHLAWKLDYAYQTGAAHRHDVLSCCSPADNREVAGELFVSNAHVRSISDTLAAQKTPQGEDALNTDAFGALLLEVEQAYGGMSVELRSDEQQMDREWEQLQQKQKARDTWLADKPARDAAARETLESEETSARSAIDSEATGAAFTKITSDFRSSKPQPKPEKKPSPKPPAPPPKKAAPQEAPKKKGGGCCG